MKAQKTARQLASLFYKANEASGHAYIKAQATNAGTPERFVLDVKASRASDKMNGYYLQLSEVLGHAPDMDEIKQLLSKWEEVTLHANSDKILVKSWINSLNTRTAIIWNNGVIFAANVVEWLKLCDDDFCELVITPNALTLKSNNSRVTFKEQPINKHPIDRIARMPFATA